MTLRFLNGCVIASYRGSTCAALAWDGLRAVQAVMTNATPPRAALNTTGKRLAQV